MRIEDFNVLFKKQKQMLYGLFLKMIREKTRFCGDLRPLIRDLLDMTYTDAYMKLLEGGLSDLPVEVIITIKAKDLFYDTFRVPKKKPKLVAMPPGMDQRTSSDLNPYQRLVRQEDMKTLDALLDDATRKLFEDTANGTSSRDTAAELEITIGTLRNRKCALRKSIQQYLEKGY